MLRGRGGGVRSSDWKFVVFTHCGECECVDSRLEIEVRLIYNV